MPIVELGNVAAKHMVRDELVDLPGTRVTTVHIPETYTLAECVRTVWHDDGLWKQHASADPAWVDSDNTVLASILSGIYGCPIGQPEDWGTHEGE